MSPAARPILLFALAVLAGCAGYDTRLSNPSVKYLGSTTSPSAQENIAEKKSYWDGSGLTGSPSIVINLQTQSASFYIGDKLAGVSAISSGREEYATPPGNYKIIQKKKDHVSNLYGDFVDAGGNKVVKNVSSKDPAPPGTKFAGAPMPYFMRLTNSGVGMHQGFLPGVPDSHGCIRMPERMVKIFWENAPLGTPVTIIN